MWILCEPETKWMVKTASEYKVKSTSLKAITKAISLFIMKSILPTTHNLHWQKERLLLLGDMLLQSKINVDKLIERVILARARRKNRNIFFPCLIL